jgi:hypothetical protein
MTGSVTPPARPKPTEKWIAAVEQSSRRFITVSDDGCTGIMRPRRLCVKAAFVAEIGTRYLLFLLKTVQAATVSNVATNRD